MAPTSVAALLAAAATAALVAMAFQLSTVAAVAPHRAPPPIGLPGCDTTCGNVSVPYPFGFGPSRCYSPMFNLTCDTSHDPPRLLLGDGTFWVTDISIEDGTVRVVRTGSIINTTGDFTSDSWRNAPFGHSFTNYSYVLSSRNELVVYGCNVEATLRANMSTAAEKTPVIRGCFTFCNGIGKARDSSFHIPGGFTVGEGSCQAPIPPGGPFLPEEFEVQAKWLYSGNHTAEQMYAPVNVFVAEKGWLNENWVKGDVQNKIVEAPLILDWWVTRTTTLDLLENVALWGHGKGVICKCFSDDYDGNPYLPPGCQAACRDCYGDCMNILRARLCRCPAGTYGDPRVEGSCVKYNFAADGLSPLTASAQIGLPNCSTTCGGVRVPYPFGISPGCYWPGFNLFCDTSSNPPRLLIPGTAIMNFFGIQVVDISLRNSTVRVIHNPKISSSYFGDGMEVQQFAPLEGDIGDPYTLSTIRNEFLVSGGDLQATLVGKYRNGSSNNAGCASSCSSGPLVVPTQTNGSRYCSGHDGCCHAPIPVGCMPEKVEFKRLSNPNTSLGNIRPLVISRSALALILEKGLTDQWYMILNRTYLPYDRVDIDNICVLSIPLVLQWSVKQGFSSSPPVDNAEQCPGDAASRLCKSEHSDCRQENGGFTCYCYAGYQGNPYVADGCQDIDECRLTEVRNSCFGDCNNLPGRFECRCPRGTHGNPLKPGGCVRSPTGLIIGLSFATGLAFLLLVLAVRSVLHKIKQHRIKVLKQKYFKQNRGQLLQQLVSQKADIAERMIIPVDELEKATNNFDKARELGGGGHGTVYKGILSDLHVVAIKKPKITVKREIDEFINEVAILSQVNHKNVVKLFGCCLETEVPLLVYEFISNGTLYDHLHVEGLRSLSWGNRLRIATEIATSIAYLHSAVSVPIIHRDIKSLNILLDDTLISKVSDFGASKYIEMDQTGFTNTIQGTRGYMDPMCMCDGRLTEKSDVYSFGVILIELLTRKKPSSYLSPKGDGLATHFVNLLVEGNLVQILDPQVIQEGGEEVQEVAAIAALCVKIRSEKRPTMRQVEHALEGLWSMKKNKKDDAVSEELDNQAHRQRIEESSRIYSLEQEMMISARYPR